MKQIIHKADRKNNAAINIKYIVSAVLLACNNNDISNLTFNPDQY